jgi:peptidoglycan/xylan/chitin deacetylase (PgdA/CDA1 family)
VSPLQLSSAPFPTAGIASPAPEPALSLRDLAKASLCGAYRYSGAMALQERLAHWSGRRFMVVLLLHRVTDEIPSDGLTVSTHWFRRLCALLRDRFHVVSVGEIIRRLEAGVIPARRMVAITFDDCYRNNLHAAEILAEHGLPACFFVPTRYVGTDHVFDWDRGIKRLPNLDWDDLRQMVRLGHEIGSHSLSHVNFAALGPEDAFYELAESRKMLEHHLECPARWFAFPYGGRGNFRPEHLSLAQAAGYTSCFSGFGGFVRPGMAGQVVPREPVPYFRSLLNFELHLTGCLDWFYGIKRKIGLLSTLHSRAAG